MATNTIKRVGDFPQTTNRKSILWGLSLAIVLALVIIFSMRFISEDYTVAPADSSQPNR